ncbi:LexA family protein [Spirosoma sp.]|uniref:LexA family protein n=1 Tax=Spirosoma sp. TaxID=1899569 RepID=UPI003B3A75CA
MIEPDDQIHAKDVFHALVKRKHAIPFFSYYVQAGFPSPAENYIERVLSLDDLCIYHQEATFFLRVGSDSMIGDRIDKGDWILMDCFYCSPEVTHNRIVVVQLGEDFAVKRIKYVDENLLTLESSNPKYPPIYVHKGDKFMVCGLVTFAFQKFI